MGKSKYAQLVCAFNREKNHFHLATKLGLGLCLRLKWFTVKIDGNCFSLFLFKYFVNNNNPRQKDFVIIAIGSKGYFNCFSSHRYNIEMKTYLILWKWSQMCPKQSHEVHSIKFFVSESRLNRISDVTMNTMYLCGLCTSFKFITLYIFYGDIFTEIRYLYPNFLVKF